MIQTHVNLQSSQYNELPLQPQLVIANNVGVPGALGTNIGVSSKEEFIRRTYELNNANACCSGCCTFRFWSLFGWICAIIRFFIGCIFATIYVAGAYKDYSDVVDADTPAFVSDADKDAWIAFDNKVEKEYKKLLIISCIVLVINFIELVSISAIIHGITLYYYKLCIFGTVMAGLNALIFGSLGCMAGLNTYSIILSITSFLYFIILFIINAFHTYNVKKAVDAWLKVNPKEMIVNDSTDKN